MLRRLSALVLAFLLAVVGATPAAACPRYQVTTVRSTMEGCGAQGLTVSAVWRQSRAGVVLESVLADPDATLGFFPLSLAVMDADNSPRYAGPNGHGLVGDGVDYEWVRGHERNSAGVRVPIGASDLNPRGWRPISGKSLRVVVVLAEARYCHAEIMIGG